MEVQTNGAAHEMQELVDVARAFVQGDFEHRLEGPFHGAFSELASHLETLRDSLKTLSPCFASSMHLIPRAGQGVAEISQQTETSVNSILGLVDEMCIEQDAVCEMLGKAAEGDTGALDIARLQEIVDKTSVSLMHMMSFLSFQDVIRQRAEKVQAMIEIVDEKIRDVLTMFKVQPHPPVDEDPEKAPGEVSLTSNEAVDQSSIDALFD